MVLSFWKSHNACYPITNNITKIELHVRGKLRRHSRKRLQNSGSRSPDSHQSHSRNASKSNHLNSFLKQTRQNLLNERVLGFSCNCFTCFGSTMPHGDDRRTFMADLLAAGTLEDENRHVRRFKAREYLHMVELGGQKGERPYSTVHYYRSSPGRSVSVGPYCLEMEHMLTSPDT